MQGKIVKGIAGFYYVHAGGTSGTGRVYECKAKGVFRKDHRKPLVGDDVEMDVLDEEQMLGNITKILPRRSELIRPAVANVDQALVIFAITKPQPNFNLLDRFLIMMGRQGLPCIICFNKQDLDTEGAGERYRDIYAGCGYDTLLVSAGQDLGVDEVKKRLAGRTTTVAGPSGVGKSSLVNRLQDNTRMQTGRISEKIDRGRHTTRHTELIAVAEDTYILDTPGFSSLGLFDLKKEELSTLYPEFAQYEKFCRFAGCSHVSEPVCGVKDAVESGEIAGMRYENYRLLYEELKAQRRY
ncbi:MAG: ribosome small subunit-dependent GTPase A [Clostridium sp.]|nr:ribosome small subunit-dependent GTPase A [Acetatifactor muris]MCM1527269.1 ribosome small subunit-dependent GTPase A [Bacteroides sp.]MCM1563037.1 ribosome small subunit-dependent GTPase A [Clostridium sp.]